MYTYLTILLFFFWQLFLLDSVAYYRTLFDADKLFFSYSPNFESRTFYSTSNRRRSRYYGESDIAF